MKQFLFLVSHLSSGSTQLSDALNDNPRVMMFCTSSNYNHFDSLKTLTSRPHKLFNSTAAIYGEHSLFNFTFCSPVLYRCCKFVYFIRNGRQTLNELVQQGHYDVQRAFLYYSFRLRRMYEMARHTPRAVFLTWEDLKNNKGLNLLESYLNLIDPLKMDTSLLVAEDKTNKLSAQADDCYERYLYLFKNLDLIRA